MSNLMKIQHSRLQMTELTNYDRWTHTNFLQACLQKVGRLSP